MTDASRALPNFTTADLPDRMTAEEVAANRFTEAALQRHKQEGLELAVRARWVALAVIAVMLPFLNPDWEMLYYEALLLLLAVNGWAMRRVGRVGQSRTELLLLFIDLALSVFVIVFPNPFSHSGWPAPMYYRFENMMYLFVLLAGGTLAYSWRTIMAIGNWTAALWLIALGILWWFTEPDPALTAATQMAFGHDPEMAKILNPNSFNFDVRIQEVVVFIIVSFTLAITVRRFNRLLLGNAALERERANLSRYFSPNVVEELSRNDEPLKQIRTHNVAVLFVDIVGFTNYAANRHPQEVIETLRAFHGRMETEVFRHHGTLDKYLGDGLMATFGTPVATENDAVNALRCARDMIDVVHAWNEQRKAAGEVEIVASFGLHYGPVVLGDIGANRLEFAVIGNTVNVASRMESLTRDLGTRLIVSDETYQQVIREAGPDDRALEGLERQAPQIIRGLDNAVPVWSVS